MNKIRLWVSFSFSLIILTGTMFLLPFASASGLTRGDTVEFGSYPQSRVQDANTVSALNKQNKKWVSYYYYSGSGDDKDGRMTTSDYMKFCDVSYNGKKYRGVTFSAYRPIRTGFTCSAENSNQDDNGYTVNTVYWFEYEPIRWRVLDPDDGLMISEKLLDSQALNNFALAADGSETVYGDMSRSYYCNNYEHSSLREWLTGDFYNVAFSDSEKSIIISSTLDNGSDNSTDDKVFIISYSDSINPSYGFSSGSGFSSNRQAKGTDYALCQGLWVDDETDCSYWRLRTQGQNSMFNYDIRFDGSVYNDYRAFSPSCGIRPAVRMGKSENTVTAVSSTEYSQINAEKDQNETVIVKPDLKKVTDSPIKTINAIVIAVVSVLTVLILLLLLKDRIMSNKRH